MDKVLENESYSVLTETPLSEVSGPGLLTHDEVDIPSRLDDQGPGDTFEWTNRLIDWSAFVTPGSNGISFGPAAALRFSWSNLLHDMMKWPMHRDIMSRYYGFNYKSIKIRITLSNPKNLVGGAMLGWFPYVDYFDESPQGTMETWFADTRSEYALYNSTDSQLMLYGSSQDVQITIPWTFKFPMIQCDWQRKLAENSQNSRPPYGSPLFYIKQLGSVEAVTDLASDAYLRYYVEFEDLKYFGPQNVYVAQSGAGAVMASAAIGAAAEEGLSYLSNKIAEAASGSNDFPVPKPGNFDNPQAVQMSYFGDTTSVDFPQTRPVFKDGLPSPNNAPMPSIRSYLEKPFLIGTTQTSLSYDFISVNPSRPMDENSSCNYMTYFSMLSRYWRGGINYHFVIAGHPLVETELTVFVAYDSPQALTPTTFNDAATHRVVRSGSYGLDVTFPYLNIKDYMHNVDPLVPFQRRDSVGRLYFRLRVIGTMMDKEPTIPMFIFASAAPDFKFYQPYPPGFYNAKETTPLGRPSAVVDEKKKMKFIAQVGLPFRDEVEVANLRAVSLPDPNIMMSIDNILDLMKIWSRALPFFDYDNGGDEEPILNATIGFQSPAWFPPVDRAREYDGDNSWYFTNDYVSMLSILFLYWRGTIGVKVASTTESTAEGYMYVSLGGIDGDAQRSKAHFPFTLTEDDLPANANFGTGCVATPRQLQPVLEISVPYRGNNIWSTVIWNGYGRGVSQYEDFHPAGVHTNINLYNESKVLTDSMYRKVDEDFALCVPSTLPPPAFWLNRGFAEDD